MLRHCQKISGLASAALQARLTAWRYISVESAYVVPKRLEHHSMSRQDFRPQHKEGAS